MAVQTPDELLNLLHLMENSRHYNAFQLQLIQSFQDFVISNSFLVKQDIDVHSKGLRQHESDTKFFKQNLDYIKFELTPKQAQFLDMLCMLMSQDNILVIKFHTAREIFGYKKHTYLQLLKDLEVKGYITRVPFDMLNINQNMGLGIMINPDIACKGKDSTQVRKLYRQLVNPEYEKGFQARHRDIKITVKQADIGSKHMTNHKIRYNSVVDIDIKKSSEDDGTSTDD